MNIYMRERTPVRRKLEEVPQVRPAIGVASRRSAVAASLTNWTVRYVNGAASALIVVALFIALVANAIVFPLILLLAGVGLFVFRYWGAIRAFDLWKLDEWMRTRSGAIGIRDWHSPYQAAEFFCNPTIVQARNEAAAEMNSIMMVLIKGQNRDIGSIVELDQGHRLGSDRLKPAVAPDLHVRYEAAQQKHNWNNAALARDLLTQLSVGNLVAKGLPAQDETTQSERLIPASRWRIMNLDIAKAEASGHGLHYIGIVVGKKAG